MFKLHSGSTEASTVLHLLKFHAKPYWNYKPLYVILTCLHHLALTYKHVLGCSCQAQDGTLLQFRYYESTLHSHRAIIGSRV